MVRNFATTQGQLNVDKKYLTCRYPNQHKGSTTCAHTSEISGATGILFPLPAQVARGVVQFFFGGVCRILVAMFWRYISCSTLLERAAKIQL